MSRRQDLDRIAERLRKSAMERTGDGGAGRSINSGPDDRLEHFARQTSQHYRPVASAQAPRDGLDWVPQPLHP